MIRRIVVYATIVTFGVLMSGQIRASNADVTYDRDADLKSLLEWVSREQSFTDAKRSEAERVIAEHRRNTTAFSDAQFYMEVRRIVGLADNGHSNVTGSPIYDTFGVVPIRTYWFSDGLYVVRAKKPHERLLGARIDAINGKKISAIEGRLLDYHSGVPALFRRYSGSALMLSPPLLHAIGLSKSPDRLTLHMTSRTGEALKVDLEVDRASGVVRAQPWRYLQHGTLAGEKDWSSIHDDSAQLPLYLQQEDELFRYVLIENGDIAYLQLRSNLGRSGNSVRDFVSRARKRLENDRPHSIIFDNRQNPGGDLGRTADFALALPSLVGPAGKVYVIIGNSTFSAGIYTSFYPKAADAERTIVVGERVADWQRFWSETGPPFKLPDSGYGIGYALKMHDPGKGCHDTDVCHLSREIFDPRWNIAVGALKPDWPAPTTFADYEALRDRPMERILEENARQRAQLAD